MDKEHLNKEGRDSSQSEYREIGYVAACNLLYWSGTMRHVVMIFTGKHGY